MENVLIHKFWKIHTTLIKIDSIVSRVMVFKVIICIFFPQVIVHAFSYYIFFSSK